jgi:1-acyl-sn-glycerol-3-phosphate acyltransferase
MIRNIITLIVVFVMTVILGIINLLILPLHNVIMISWSWILLQVAGIKLDITGREHIPAQGPGVIIMNHESALDIPIAVVALNVPVRFMAKQELFRIPVFGWCLSLCHHIPIDRQDTKRAVESINKVSSSIIKRKQFVIVSPEGTRSFDGKIKTFKKGGFRLAEQQNLPLIPVTLMGTRFCVPKKSFKLIPGTVQVAIDRPVHIGDFDNIDECVNHVRDIIVNRKERYEQSRAGIV